MPARFVILLLLLLLVAAAPPDPADLVRRGNAAMHRGDPAAARPLYEAAGGRAADPGLVAFNAAAARVAEKDFRAAELLYLQALADAECPPDRRAKAEYNRGVCLVKRGGAPALRAAVGCFERTLAGNPDPALAADARHNLELAKLLWNEARLKAPRPAAPNDPPADEPKTPPAAEPDRGTPAGTDPGGENGTGGTRTVSQPATGPPTATAADPGTQAAGAGTLDVIPDEPAPKPLPPEDVREHLRRADARLQKARRDLRNTLAPPDRPGVRDW